MRRPDRLSPQPAAVAPVGSRFRVVDQLVAGIAASGVRHVFGVGGANIEDLYDALHLSGAVRGILAKHEYSAATMADGYARATGRLGVVATTSGGGALNALAALGEAYTSRVPVLALVGQPPTALDGRGSFQDSSGHGGSLDAERIFGSVARYCARVNSPRDLPRRLAEAIASAETSPGGPSVLLLPKDVQRAPAAPSSRPRPLEPAPTADPPTPHDLSRAALLLDSARSNGGGVLVIAGDGVARTGTREPLAALAEALDAAVAVTPDAKDVFDNQAPRFVGVCGNMGHPSVRDALGASSACLLVGTRLPVLARDGLEDLLTGMPVVSVSAEPPYLEALTVIGCLRTSLAALTQRVRRPNPRTARPVPPLRHLPVPPRGDATLGYQDVMTAIGHALPGDARVFVDAGNCGAAAIHHLAAPRRGQFVVALGMGGMGYTFGAAVGASFAAVDRPGRIHVVAGDGAFYMHGFELHTAVQYSLPITFIILNNNAHAMCVTREQVYYGGEYSYNRFTPARLAAGIGAMFPSVSARNARTVEELTDALVETRVEAGPAFVSVDCDVDEIPPVAQFLDKEMLPCPQ